MNDIEKIHNTFSDANVLYVEDEETVQRMSLPLYKKLFGNVDTASNGEEGLALFNENHYDIIITDFRMPKMDGRQMIKNILKLTSDVIIIVLTASESDMDIQKDMTDVYLTKPFGLMDLIDALKSIEDKYHKIKKIKIKLHSNS